MSAALALQGAIVQRLRSYDGLAETVGQRVYDSVPADAEFPYIDIGEDDAIRRDATCIRGETIFLTLHAWSRAVGMPEVKRISSAVAEALHNFPLEITGYKLVSFEHRRNRTMMDADGLTAHAVIECVAYVHRL